MYVECFCFAGDTISPFVKCAPHRCLHPQVLVDMSCGSGLFSRRFVRSGRFKGVVAADFSESMLTQAKEFFSTDAALDPRYAVNRGHVLQ